MSKVLSRLTFGLALAVLSQPLAALAATPADTVITGGPIYTADDARPKAEAVAVSAGRIIYVGDRAGAQALIGPKTELIDLKGASLYPGFTDSHVHLDGVGDRELTLNLEGSHSAAEVAARVKARMPSVKPGEILFGRGWIETGWPEKRFLQASDIDAVAPDNPVILERADGHAMTANTAALRLAGISEATPVPFGGAINRDPQGHLTGMLVDNAMSLLDKVRPVETAEHRVQALKVGMAVENRHGWTGVHFMSAPWGDVMALEALAARGEAPLRVYAAVDREDVDKLFASGPRSAGDGRIVTRAIKLYADGALGSRGAALWAPYSDDGANTGLFRFKDDDTRAVLADAAAHGIQVCTHAIGDRANAITLEAIRHARGRLQSGMTSADIGALVDNASAAMGASPDGALVLLNEASAYPHGSHQKQVVREGSVVLMDCGCSVHGYTSDISRTMIFGAPTPRQRKVRGTACLA